MGSPQMCTELSSPDPSLLEELCVQPLSLGVKQQMQLWAAISSRVTSTMPDLG